MGGLRGCPSGARYMYLYVFAYMGGLRGCPSGDRVLVLVGLCLHGWIERLSIRCPCTCICLGRSIPTWVD